MYYIIFVHSSKDLSFNIQKGLQEHLFIVYTTIQIIYYGNMANDI